MKRATRPVDGTNKASEFASEEDAISSMPKKVITNILDRLPIQVAVRTGILSRNWRFKWTMLTQLVFDKKFFEYLLGLKGGNSFKGKNLSRILLHIKGEVTKFVLYIPVEYHFIFDVEDINHWVMFLSTKGIKEFTLINMHETSIKLPTHLFSCLKLKHLELHKCRFLPVLSFSGFPNLLTLDFNMIIFESCNFRKFISQCPLLESLRIDHQGCMGKVKFFEIAKLGNLKTLFLSLCKIDNIVITSSDIFRLLGNLPKLEELALDFRKCKFMAEAGARKKVSASFCLKTLTLCKLDFNSRVMVLLAIDLIHGSPNLQTLKITATHENRIMPPFLSSCEVNEGIMGNLQLRIVELECIKDSEIELCLIKSLLAHCSLLRKMVINHIISEEPGSRHKKYVFARKLLKFYRASPIAVIDLN